MTSSTEKPDPFLACAEAVEEWSRPHFVYRSGADIYGPDLVETGAVRFGDILAAKFGLKQ